MNIQFAPIAKESINTILPLLQELNKKTPLHLLKERITAMASYTNYECIGAYHNEKLIGIMGLWYSVRHYVGKSVEPDHVIISSAYRGKNIGKNFFNWIYTYTKQKGCEAIELNTYTGNQKSHKFYYNEDFNIYGFHFVKILRENKNFF